MDIFNQVFSNQNSVNSEFVYKFVEEFEGIPESPISGGSGDFKSQLGE
jgi:hypothetical protein